MARERMRILIRKIELRSTTNSCDARPPRRAGEYPRLQPEPFWEDPTVSPPERLASRAQKCPRLQPEPFWEGPDGFHPPLGLLVHPKSACPGPGPIPSQNYFELDYVLSVIYIYIYIYIYIHTYTRTYVY